jgi:hypothetical protein
MRSVGLAAAALALVACKSGGAAPKLVGGTGVIGNTATACQARQVGQVLAESAAVDATDLAIYWIDYNGGTLQRRSRGDGPVQTLMQWHDEHLSDSLRVANGWIYWTSKAASAVYRLPDAGGADPEAIIQTDRMLAEVEVVGDTVYASTFDGVLLWWRSPGEHGELVVGDGPFAMAATVDALYVGSEHGIARLASPGAGLQPVLATDAPVERLSVSADSIYWVEAGNLKRRVAGGDPEVFAASSESPLLAATLDGVFLAQSNVVYFVADTSTEPVPVAIAATEITDLELRRASMFVGTTQGSVEELCPDPTAPVTLAEPDPTCGDCEWYGSGALERRRSTTADGDLVEESFYADGTPMSISSATDFRAFYVTGDPAE